MRIIHARFKGLQGLYRNSMQKEINIDFEKCIHRIIYIVGPNGSGKSTLMSAMHPLPDPPSMYLDKELGEKELILDNNGTIYNILIQYPVYANGSRATTKAFIKEISPDGTCIELNANGTVGSFKDIVYSRFNLDPNFVALSYLSVEDRGIVEKKPSERKKFVATLLESLEVYNDIYKTLVKRSSVFKSMINSITAKIDSVGNQEKLMMDKVSIDNRINSLEQQKSSLESTIAASRATISLIDPDNAIRNLYNDLVTEYNSIKSSLNMLMVDIKDSKVKSLDDANVLYFNLRQEEFSKEKDIEVLRNKISTTLTSREEESRLIVIKTQKYNSIISSISDTDLERTITEYRKRIFQYENVFKKIGIEPGAVTKDEYVLGLNTLEDLRTSILNIKSYSSDDDIQMACNGLLGNINIAQMISETSINISLVEDEIASIKDKMGEYRVLYQRSLILKDRPSNCVINTCSFIKDALEAESMKPEENLTRLDLDLDRKSKELSRYRDILTNLQSANKTYSDLRSVIRSFINNKMILDKLPIDKRMFEISYLVEIISSGDQMNDIYDLYQYIEYANIFELYKNEAEALRKLEADFDIDKAQRKVAGEILDDLNELKKKVSGIDIEIERTQNMIKDLEKDIVVIKEELQSFDKLISTFKTIEEYQSQMKELESKLKTVSTNIDRISSEVDMINKNQSILTGVIRELGPLKQNADSINYSLAKLQEYQNELNEYNGRYSTIELLKKYSSPTKGGIQTIFMQLYMDKTLSLANQLLGLVFGGKLELLPYIINENEFRIPTKSNVTNLIVDDVSNCSTSEKSMIAMTMSFALAFHGSPLYNIVRLDEIDGGLDQDNRSMFPVVCRNMVDMLGIEQCFVISHSSESDMSDIDIISLYQDSWKLSGNVIFSL